MVGVQPGTLGSVSSAASNSRVSNGARVSVSKRRNGFVAPGKSALHQQQILQADAVLVRQVVARLVRQDHPLGDRHRLGQARQADRPLVHREIAANAMAGAMVVVQPRLPQRAAGKASRCTPPTPPGTPRWRWRCGLSAPASPARATRRWRAGAGPDGAGDVGCAVLELRAAVDQVDLVGVQLAVGGLGHPVVDDRAVLAGAGDRGEAFAAEASTSARSASSFSAAEISVAVPAGPTWASQCRKRQMATASRAWAARAPARSVSFLQALGSRQGSGPAATSRRPHAAPGRTIPGSRRDPPARVFPPGQRAGQRVAPGHRDAACPATHASCAAAWPGP